MDHFSFEEDEEPRQLHCLEQEIGEQEIDTWMGTSHERADEEPEWEDNILSHFDLNIPSTEELPNIKDSVCLQVCEVLDPQDDSVLQEKNMVIDEQSGPQPLQQSSQEGSTFYCQQNMSTTVVQGSAVDQKWQKESGKALDEFISLSESIYTPMLRSFRQILRDVRQFSDKTLENVNMYHLLFSIKLQQQKERCRILRSKGEGMQALLKQNTLLGGVYLDEKVTLQQMWDHDADRLEALTNFCESIEQTCSKLQLLLSKSVEFRSKKIEYVMSFIDRTEKIHTELIQFITNPPSLTDSSNLMPKTDIRCDRYLQRKFLKEKERLFLTQIKALGEKIVGLLHSIFIKEEPIIFALLAKETDRYHGLSRQVYGGSQEYFQCAKVEIGAINEDLKEALADIIPGQWKMFINKDESHIEQIIDQIHSYMQNHIFLPTVAIDEDLVLARLQAKWVCKSQTSPAKHKKAKITSSHSKQNQLQGANQATFTAFLSDRTTKQSVSKAKGMDVSVVLTVDKYLHLESGEKIACLKMKHLKLKKKGDRSIIINENNRSITSLFSVSPYLGELVFPDEQSADEFANAAMLTQK